MEEFPQFYCCARSFFGVGISSPKAPKEGFPCNNSGGIIWSFGQTYGFVAYLATNFLQKADVLKLHVIYLAAVWIEMKETCPHSTELPKRQQRKRGAPSCFCLEPLPKKIGPHLGVNSFCFAFTWWFTFAFEVHPRRPGWVRWRENCAVYHPPKEKNGEMKWWFSKVPNLLFSEVIFRWTMLNFRGCMFLIIVLDVSGASKGCLPWIRHPLRVSKRHPGRKVLSQMTKILPFYVGDICFFHRPLAICKTSWWKNLFGWNPLGFGGPEDVEIPFLATSQTARYQEYANPKVNPLNLTTRMAYILRFFPHRKDGEKDETLSEFLLFFFETEQETCLDVQVSNHPDCRCA